MSKREAKRTLIHKALHIKLKIEQHEPPKNRGFFGRVTVSDQVH